MNVDFSPERSDAIRSLLVSTALPARRATHVLASVGLVVLGLTVGASVSAAAISLNAPVQQASADSPSIATPDGLIPGQPIIAAVGSPVSQAVRGDADIDLGLLPAGTTHARVTITCLTAGTTTWGPDPSGNNPSIACTEDDAADASGGAFYDFPVDDSTTTLFVRAASETEIVISYQFLNYVETQWGVNARGETFGASKEGLAEPDLVAVTALDAKGDYVMAYARRTDLEAFGPEWPGQPSNPTEATAWQTERDQKYPNGWDIPAYESDGLTEVGVFHIGG